MKIERKGFPAEWKAQDDGTIEGYGAVFGNVDSHGDIIVRGAFNASLNKRKVKMLWQHDPSQPIGVWDEISEDDRGLRMNGRILADVEKGREAIALMKAGAIEGLSIGYRTEDSEWRDNARVLKAVDLYETSIVTFPANDLALASVKSLATERECEDALREIGFSRTEAKAFVARGWGGVKGLRDAGNNLSDQDLRDAEAVKNQLSTLIERIGK